MQTAYPMNTSPEPTGGLSAAAQDYLNRVNAYAAQKKAEGYLVSDPHIWGPGGDLNAAYETLAAHDTPVESLFSLGHQFLTNAGKKAKTKRNPTAQIWAEPDRQYRITNERGQNEVLYTGTGQEGLDEVYRIASELSGTQGKKADWKLETYQPDLNKWVPWADDDPPGGLGKILDIALPILGALAIPLTGGISGALGAAIGGAGGSALSGTIQGRGIGDILKGAALSGGLSYLGGSLLGPGASGGSSAASAAGAGSSAAGGAVGGGLSSLPGEIVVQGIKNAAPGLIGGAAGAAAGSGLSGALNAAQPSSHNYLNDLNNDIVVTGTPSSGGALGGAAGAAGGALGGDIVVSGQPPPSLDDIALGGAAVGLPAAGGSGSPPSGNSTLDNIVDYLQAAGLGTGLIGNLFGGSGGGSEGGTIPGGLNGALNPIFSADLPAPHIPGVGSPENLAPRQMNEDDWYTYATRPEKSFFDYVPQRMAKGGFAVKRYNQGGSVEDRSTWGKRADGTDKGSGFLGVLKRPDGRISSELSIGVEMDGKEVEIPTLVPGLTDDEINWLLNTPEDDQVGNMPRSIVDKAVAHARKRMDEGLSPFAGDDETPKKRGGFAVKGPGNGRSDGIPAKLSDGEYVIDAETVSLLGDGSSEAGAKVLDRFRVNVRKDKGKNLAKGKFSVKAKKPEHYMKGHG